MNIENSHSEKFRGGRDFERWQQKMLFYLTTMNLAHVLKEEPPPVPDENGAWKVWKHTDYLCKNYILNGLDDVLYGVYSTRATAKQLWESLEKIYKAEDVVGSRTFVVGKFLRFKMNDSKSVVGQVEDFQIIIDEMLVNGMDMSESFQVESVIEKLPPSWKEFKNYCLKRKWKEMTMEDLIVRLRMEEDDRRDGNGITSKQEFRCRRNKRKFGKKI